MLTNVKEIQKKIPTYIRLKYISVVPTEFTDEYQLFRWKDKLFNMLPQLVTRLKKLYPNLILHPKKISN